MIKGPFVVAMCLLLPWAAAAFAEDDWLPVTDADRKILPDPALGSHDAVAILSRVEIEDGMSGKSTRTVYHRVKIFTQEGAKFADISIPFVKGRMKVTSVAARIVLPDGSVEEISQDRIHEEDFFETDNLTVGRKALSIPGVIAGSIIDYRFTVQSKEYHHTWYLNTGIPLLHGELRWKPYRQLFLTPNSAWVNVPPQCTTRMQALPDDESPEELVYSIESLPPPREEPYTMPDAVITPQLLCYYAGRRTPTQYWAEESQKYRRGIDAYLAENDGAKEIADSLAPGMSLPARIRFAYEWIQSNFHNTSVDTSGSDLDEDDEAMADNLETLLERRSGNSVELNLALVGVLRAMGITADLCLAVDNRYNRYNHTLKYWQFDRTLVRASPPGGNVVYMTPDEPLAPFGMVPWYLEGTEVIVPGYTLEVNFILPPSPPSANETKRQLVITTADSMGLQGRFSEILTGQSAVALRSSIRGLKERAREDFFRNHIRKTFPDGEIDSLLGDTGTGTSAPVVLSCFLDLPPATRDGDRRIVFHPFTTLGTPANPFIDPKREHPVAMDFARLIKDEVRFLIPPGWSVQEPIAEDLFGGDLGSGIVSGRVAGDTLIVNRTFTLKAAFWNVADYRVGQDLFRRYAATKDFAVILARKPK